MKRSTIIFIIILVVVIAGFAIWLPLGFPPHKTLKELTSELSDEDPAIKRDAIIGIGGMGVEGIGALEMLIDALGNDDPPVKASAASVISMWGDEPEVVERLTEALESGNTAVRIGAITALRNIGTKPGVVDAITRALGDPDETVRARAASTLGSFGSEASGAVPALLNIFGESNTELKGVILRALGQIGPEPGVVDMLLASLDSIDNPVFTSACYGLGEIGAEDGVVDALTAKASDDALQWREDAIEALGAIGPDASSATGVILEALHSPVQQVRLEAVRALPKVKPSREIVPALIGELSDESGTVVSAAVKSLGLLGNEASEAVPSLRGLLESGELIRISAARALYLIDAREVDESVDVLLKIIRGGKSKYQAMAAYELGSIGPGAARALPELKEIIANAPYRREPRGIDDTPLGFQDTFNGKIGKLVFVSAAYAVASIEDESPDALYLLVQAVGDEEYDVSKDAIEALGKLGKKAEAALPLLKELSVKSVWHWQRVASRKAVKEIEG